MSKKEKVIVTGGAGFIGSHLVDELIKRGFRVHVIDNFAGGKKENKNPKANYHKLDIRKLKKIKPIFKDATFVFHLAALPKVQFSIKNPILTNDVNVNGTLNVLIASKEAKVKRLIYAASSSVYGEQKKFPLCEDFPANPLSPYGLQKHIGELNCRVFSKIHGLETVSLRYFNVYGPRQNTDGAYALVIGRFLKQKKEGRPLTIVPTGRQSRDFTYISDVVRANMLAMRSRKVGKGEVINIGAGKDRSILEVAKIIGGPTVFIKPRIEPKKSLADIARAKKLLGWQPKVTLREGISRLL